MEAPDLVPRYYDSHMHTTLCKHARGLPEEYAEFALNRGLAGIIFTCHSPMPRGFWPHVRMDDSQFDEYVAMVHRCRVPQRLALKHIQFQGGRRTAGAYDTELAVHDPRHPSRLAG
jgi:hypothetical protein